MTATSHRFKRSQIAMYVIFVVLAIAALVQNFLAIRSQESSQHLGFLIVAELDSARIERRVALGDLHALLMENRARSIANRQDIRMIAARIRADLSKTAAVVDSARLALPKRKR